MNLDDLDKSISEILAQKLQFVQNVVRKMILL